MTIIINPGKSLPARVLILIPSPYFFYLNQGLALRQAFMNNGVDSLLLVDKIDEHSLASLLSGYKPDVVFSINSFKPPVMEGFPGMLHVRWIQDNQFDVDYRKETADPASDFCYTATSRLSKAIRSRGTRHSGILRFAATPTNAGFADNCQSAFSLVAYIPPTSMIDIAFEVGKERKFTGWDYFEFLNALQPDSLDTQLEHLDQIVEVFLHTQGTARQQVPEDLLRLFREEYFRASNRYRFTKKVLSLGFGCRIYGMQEWTTWPEFAPYYQGPLPTMEGNYEVFRTTALNLHNGGTVSHPRVFECMAAFGGPILVNRTLAEDDLDFEPGIHYVEYDLSDFEPIAKDLLGNPAKRREISGRAYELVAQKHTWDLRVKQLLSDIARYS